MKTSFKLNFDVHGNSTNFYSNGLVAYKVKYNKETLGYTILELKTGLPVYVRDTSPTRNTMLISIKRDLMRLFEFNQSSAAVYSERLSLKRRSLS